MHTNDRRIFQRLRLPRPILGTLDGQNTLILDIGVIGAFVEHYGVTTPKTRSRLQFQWQGYPIEIVCEVARTEVVRRAGANALSHTGLGTAARPHRIVCRKDAGRAESKR